MLKVLQRITDSEVKDLHQNQYEGTLEEFYLIF